MTELGQTTRFGRSSTIMETNVFNDVDIYLSQNHFAPGSRFTFKYPDSSSKCRYLEVSSESRYDEHVDLNKRKLRAYYELSNINGECYDKDLSDIRKGNMGMCICVRFKGVARFSEPSMALLVETKLTNSSNQLSINKGSPIRNRFLCRLPARLWGVKFGGNSNNIKIYVSLFEQTKKENNECNSCFDSLDINKIPTRRKECSNNTNYDSSYGDFNSDTESIDSQGYTRDESVVVGPHCEHTYHAKCLKRWPSSLKDNGLRNNHCPLCYVNVETEDLIYSPFQDANGHFQGNHYLYGEFRDLHHVNIITKTLKSELHFPNTEVINPDTFQIVGRNYRKSANDVLFGIRPRD